MHFAIQSLAAQKKAASSLRKTLIGMETKQHPTRGGYGQGNTNENPNRDELQDKEAVARRSTTLQDSEPAEDHRRDYSGHEHHKTCCGREEKSAQDSHAYCSRVTRIHSFI